MEVNEPLGLTAAACIRAQLKANPHVLMIDCPLDEEVALLAAGVANRGTIVLLGVEAASAADGIAHMETLGVSGDMLASVLEASIGVAVVRTLCAQSRVIAHPGRSQLHALEDALNIKTVLDDLKAEQRIADDVVWKNADFYTPEACAECDGGYRGVSGLQEVVSVTRMLKEHIRQDASPQELAMDAAREGTLSLADDALAKALLGLVGMEDLVTLAGRV
jgi:type IV pilus assembly protein PilB